MATLPERTSSRIKPWGQRQFELWCSGQLLPESLLKVEEARERINKARYEIELLRGPEIMKLFTAGRDKAHGIVFEKHFLKPYEPKEFFGWDKEEDVIAAASPTPSPAASPAHQSISTNPGNELKTV